MSERFPGNHRVLAVANIAGSAGKTTTVVTLASLLAEQGRRVLVVDLDGQANASTWLGVEQPAATTADVLLKRSPVEDVVVETSVAGVSLLPADEGLYGLDQQIAASPSVGSEQRLRVALRRVRDEHDVVLLDCPGAINSATFAALIAADAVLSVVMPTVKELEGVPKLAGIVEEVVEAYGGDLSLRAVIPCAVPPASAGKMYAEAVAMLHEDMPELATPSVRRSVRVAEAYAHRIPLPAWAARAEATQDYRAVLEWLIERGLA
ncbi:MAG: ParA family protein [Micrococcus sp.]|nr:ParA family protein [Micrococcus sp.]